MSDWNMFVKAHKGHGKTMTELAAMYKATKATPKIKARVRKPALTKLKCVSRCTAGVAKGSKLAKTKCRKVGGALVGGNPMVIHGLY